MGVGCDFGFGLGREGGLTLWYALWDVGYVL